MFPPQLGSSERPCLRLQGAPQAAVPLPGRGSGPPVRGVRPQGGHVDAQAGREGAEPAQSGDDRGALPGAPAGHRRGRRGGARVRERRTQRGGACAGQKQVSMFYAIKGITTSFQYAFVIIFEK